MKRIATSRTPQATDKEIISFTRSTALPSVEWLTVQNSTRRWQAFHERYGVCICPTGATSVRYRNREHVLDGCWSLFFFEPGETHLNTKNVFAPNGFKVLHFLPAVFEETMRQVGHPGLSHFRAFQDRNQSIFQTFNQLHLSMEAGETELEQQSRLTNCLHLLVENYMERTPLSAPTKNSHTAAQRAKTFLRERFDQPVSLDELATVAGLSRFHLLRTFTKHFGFPPHAYQNHLRVEQAKTMLREGVPPSMAAISVGFADHSHFIRHFRRTYGVTPSTYAGYSRSPRLKTNTWDDSGVSRMS